MFADSLNPVSHDDFQFGDDPERIATFRSSIEKVRALPCDLLISAHPSQSRLFERQAKDALVDAGACQTYADEASARLDQRLATERTQAPID